MSVTQRFAHTANQAARSAARMGPAAAVVLAACLGANGAHAQTYPGGGQGWQFSVTPYIWATSISGTLKYKLPPSIDATHGDVKLPAVNLLKALNGAAMISAEARYDRFTILGDVIYLSLGKSTSSVRSIDLAAGGNILVSGSLDAGTQTELSGSLVSLGGGYSLISGTWGNLDATAGVRVFSLHASTDVRLSADVTGPTYRTGGGVQTQLVYRRLSRNVGLHDNVTLVDGVAGLRGRAILGAGFYLPVSADVGGGSSNLTWQMMGGASYGFGWGDVTLGYRHLYYEQGQTKLVQNLTFSGPFLAAAFTF